MDGRRVLCVDPDPATRSETVEHLATDLEDLSPSISAAASAARAREILRNDPVDCLITAYDLPDGTGIELADATRQTSPDTGCILFTATDPASLRTDETSGPVVEYLPKDAPNARERLAQFVRVTVTERSQTGYPVPQSEDERLAALREYDLDSPALRRSLDRLTDLAGMHFDVPMASVNVIDEHTQEFLACHGRAESWETGTRDDSICTFTILEDDPVMIVEDVHDDPRFDAVDELDRTGIRSYMGAVVTTSAGLEMGTLCVYDDEPRSYSAADREYLRTLAGVATDLLEVHARTGPADRSGPSADGGGA